MPVAVRAPLRPVAILLLAFAGCTTTQLRDSTVRDSARRPVNAIADNQEAQNVTSVEVRLTGDAGVDLLFDPDERFEQRILREPFA